MRFLIFILFTFFFAKTFGHSFYKIYENPKYDNYRGIVFNDLILAIATNESVIFGIISKNLTFVEIGSKYLTTYVIGESKLMEFKYIQKHIVIICSDYDCCYCKVYDPDDKCKILINVRKYHMPQYDSINAQQEMNILFLRYTMHKYLAVFDMYEYVDDEYRLIKRFPDRLNPKGIFTSHFSFTQDNHFYFVTEFEKSNKSNCIFPKEFETKLNEIYFILTQFCNTNSAAGLLTRMDLMLSCGTLNASDTEKLKTRGVFYNKRKDFLTFTLEDAKNSTFFCEFDMITIKKSFCNTWNYCQENPYKGLQKFSKECQEDEKEYGERCFKEETSTDYCENPKQHQKYLVNSCQVTEILNSSYVGKEDPEIIYGKNTNTIGKWHSYGMLATSEQFFILRKRQIWKSIFNEPLIKYESTKLMVEFVIDSEKYMVPWDSKKGVFYIDPKAQNSVYFKTIFCPIDECTEYFFDSLIECTHSFCTDEEVCLKKEHYLFCGPLWLNVTAYNSERTLITENGTKKIECAPLKFNSKEKCTNNLQDQHKNFLTAPIINSAIKNSNPNNFLSMTLIILTVFIVSLIFIICGVFVIKKLLLRRKGQKNPSMNIQMNDLQQVSTSQQIPATPTVECDSIDQYGEIDKYKMIKDKILGRGVCGYVRMEILIVNNKVKKVAVKYLHKPYDESDLLREIKAIKSCNHPNIVKFIGFVQNDDGMGIVTEFMEGGDLHEHLINPSKAIMVSQIFTFITQIVDAMVYLYYMHILHRDIAARNCLLNASHTVVKINDFGLAREMDQFYQYYTEEKRPLPMRWFPMEVMDEVNRKKFTSKVDIWSFGVLIWEMFERGATPYNGMDFDTFKSFLKSGERLRRPQHCPDELYELMKQCWHVNPLERPTFDTLKNQIALIINGIETNEPAKMNVVTEFKAENVHEHANATTDETQNAEPLRIKVTAAFDEEDVCELPKSDAGVAEPLLCRDDNN